MPASASCFFRSFLLATTIFAAATSSPSGSSYFLHNYYNASYHTLSYFIFSLARYKSTYLGFLDHDRFISSKGFATLHLPVRVRIMVGLGISPLGCLARSLKEYFHRDKVSIFTFALFSSSGRGLHRLKVRRSYVVKVVLRLALVNVSNFLMYLCALA